MGDKEGEEQDRYCQGTQQPACGKYPLPTVPNLEWRTNIPLDKPNCHRCYQVHRKLCLGFRKIVHAGEILLVFGQVTIVTSEHIFLDFPEFAFVPVYCMSDRSKPAPSIRLDINGANNGLPRDVRMHEKLQGWRMRLLQSIHRFSMIYTS